MRNNRAGGRVYSAVRLAFWRGLLWFGAILSFVVVAAGVLAAVAAPQSLRLKAEMMSFCAMFRVGHPINASEIARRAREQDYRTLRPFAVPAETPLTAVTVYQFSPTGTRWSCTVHIREGHVAATKLAANSPAD